MLVTRHKNNCNRRLSPVILEFRRQSPIYRNSRRPSISIPKVLNPITHGENMTTNQTKLGGTSPFPKTSSRVYRMGYGAMQLSGPEIFGPPRDVDAAIAVLRQAVASGVNHIDTSDYYGPHITNQIIKRALHPYPAGLVIVTKLG